jgi:hypothetical protein
MNAKYVDLLTRAGWTGVQAAVSFGIVGLADVSTWWAVPLSLTLSALKTWLLGRTAAKAA